ncbi:hypothetical protein [Paraburkholderia bryophila]|uniref:Lipoprotein n=1 Tax=Paraburkholderia bryophila TaxID=420952 RepID=A0A7Y9WCK2_9BURK|nr:hypothetical protein [Paraburkholderia bryophila]NYH18372.1 hypothetical protein [Paraburkholderia bryophila]NYH22538.1 hypothetical protein [Paraburkholderia bryophila]
MKTIRRLFARARVSAVFPLLVACALAACTPTFGVYNPVDAPGEPQGKIEPLSSYLPPGVTDVKLVFIHGVGDHCPGYALSGAGSSGWLSVEHAARIGLTPIDAQPRTYPPIYSDEFLPGKGGKAHPFDKKSYVAIRTQHFRYGKTGAVVEAIEITWSPLTQWVKNNQLEDDFTKAGIVECGPDVPNGAVEAVSRLPDPAAQPPSRLPLNRLLKENVLDRSLADAGLYMGQYRSVLQLGLADALCHTLTGQESASDPAAAAGRPCRWQVSDEDLKTRYLFVTHSLGSRLLYDTLLGLMGYRTPGVDQDLFATQSPNSQEFTANVMKNTPVVYMMANQLAFLGLGNLPIDALSSEPEGQRAQVVPPTVESLRTLGLSRMKGSVEIASATQPSVDACGTNDPCRLGLLKNVAVAVWDNTPLATTPAASPTLDMIAFSDTNDLLSWSVPKWYQQHAAGPDGGQTTPVKFVNVYVKNATHWLGLAESPLPAHDDYFINSQVLQTIRCGADRATVRDCPAAQ